MNIDQLNVSSLKYFIDTVETQSLTKSAEMNFVTRPAISQAIYRLEEWSGKSLTTHGRKVFTLTEEGQNFYKTAKLAYNRIKESFIEQTQNDYSLKIGCSSSLVETVLLPKLSQIKKLGDLSLKVGNSYQLNHMFNENLIHISVSIQPSRRSHVDHQIISEGNFVLASRDGKMKKQIVLTEDRPETLGLRSSFKNKKTPPIYAVVDSWSMAVNTARTLDYACLIPDFLISPKMKKIKLSQFKYTYAIELAHRPLEYLSHAEKELLKKLIKKSR